MLPIDFDQMLKMLVPHSSYLIEIGESVIVFVGELHFSSQNRNKQNLVFLESFDLNWNVVQMNQTATSSKAETNKWTKHLTKQKKREFSLQIFWIIHRVHLTMHK